MPNFTTSDGLDIYYETHGFEKSAPVLVFLNGMTQTTRHWTTHARDLRGQRPVLTYDARGQGQSDVPADSPELADHIRDLRELVAEVDIDAIDLVGFSHGARIALGVGARHPDPVRRLVLCSATAQPTALARTIVRSWREVLDRGGMEAMAWTSLTDIVGNRFLENHEGMLDNIIRASVDRNTEAGTRRLLEGLENFPPLDELTGDIDIPTLVISASNDPLVAPEGARQLADLCGGAHQLVDDCGHTIPIERPDAFQDIVVDFLGQK